MLKLLQTYLIRAAIACAVASIGVSLISYLRSAETKKVEIDSFEQVLTGITAREEHPCEFHVYNPTGRAVRLLGIDYTCGYNCCLRPKLTEPVLVAPRETATVTILVRANSGGPFHDDFTLFVEEGKELSSFVMKVRGDAVSVAVPESAEKVQQ